MVRAVDRPQLQLLAILELHRRVHVLRVKLGVAALAVEVESRDVRRAHVLVPARELLVDDEALELAADGRTVGEPQRKARTDAVVDRKELEVLAELLVVALLGFLQELQVVVELFL